MPEKYGQVTPNSSSAVTHKPSLSDNPPRTGRASTGAVRAGRGQGKEGDMKSQLGVQGEKGMIVKTGAFLVSVLLCVLGISATSAVAAPPAITGTTASSVSSTSATLEAQVNPQSLKTLYHFEYGLGSCASNPCASVPVPDAEVSAGSSSVPVEVTIEGLQPATIYHFRLVAKNGATTKGPDRTFNTYSTTLSGLPDGRAYEQSSPVEKDGGDITGKAALVKAADDGNGITFGNTFGIPGGVGAQGLPLYLAKRSASTWSTQGLFPPASAGERAQPLGWLPDFSKTFFNATKLGDPRTKSLLMLSTSGAPPTTISPYVAKAEYTYAGSSADASTVLFESKAQLPSKAGQPPIAAALQGSPNLYAWSQTTGELRLAGVLNDGKVPAGGTLAGAPDSSNYREEEHVVSASGDVYFTAVGAKQLYLRRNPTKAQSPLDGEGKCTDPNLACTIHISASQKTNGNGPGGTDPAGPQKATFQAATPDGSEAFFTSSEKLTNDANTGPEQPLASIGRSGIEGGIENDEFIPAQHAIGVAVDGSHIYWVDPTAGTIGRANLDGSEANDAFIAPGAVEYEVEVEIGEDEFETETISVPSSPRWVAVDSGHIYWTNTGRFEGERPAEEGGTIGRANLDGTEVEPAFIRGASDPQGIAVNATHIYWANNGSGSDRAISRAAIDGSEIELGFLGTQGGSIPYGVALSADHVYFAEDEPTNDNSYVRRAPLVGGEADGLLFVGKAGIRGVAVDGAHVYWSSQSEQEIGRADLNLENPEKGLVEAEGGLVGIAIDADHIYWSVNGEAPTNPGNDLYRYRPATGQLSDLTADSTDEDGADVQGVLGVSADGSYAYFAANGDLDGGGPATPGDCEGGVSSLTGSCNLYVWHEGTISFISRLKGATGGGSDALNWTQKPSELSGRYVAKTSSVSPDGQTLVFRTQEKLSAYDNEGVAQFYRYRVGDPEAIRCLTCNPAGEAPGEAPSTGSITFPGLQPLSAVAVASRNMSSDGNRFFFETPEALSPDDTNGQGGCPPSGGPAQRFVLACLDVYEWEAPGTGTCTEGAPSYRPANRGCLYLISTGKDSYPSLIADASANGSDVFFFTRQGLVGQDTDEQQDVYDARVGGGIASQNQTPKVICPSAEACHGSPQVPPAESSPATPSFVGPGNQVPKHKKQSAKKKKGKQAKHKHKKGKGKKHKRANEKGRASR